MRKLSLVRRLLALAAAYVVALQLALLPMTVAAGSAASGPLCSQLADPAGPEALKDDTGCACAAGCGAQCCAPGLAGWPPDAASVSWTAVAELLPATATLDVDAGRQRVPNNPRAPPSV